MVIRKIIKIDEEKCNGCGACARACHEGAIAMVNGKAKLIRDDYCDGLGDCLPNCPTGAITFVEREAAEYNRAAVEENMKQKRAQQHFGCPGTQARKIETVSTCGEMQNTADCGCVSCLSQWPVQIKLVPTKADYFDGGSLLIAADCTAFARADFHSRFISGRTTIIGCPKLDGIDYSQKLAEIIKNNDVKSVTVTRMEVPCCGGLEMAVKKAIAASGKDLMCNVTTIALDGRILQ